MEVATRRSQNWVNWLFAPLHFSLRGRVSISSPGPTAATGQDSTWQTVHAETHHQPSTSGPLVRFFFFLLKLRQSDTRSSRVSGDDTGTRRPERSVLARPLASRRKRRKGSIIEFGLFVGTDLPTAPWPPSCASARRARLRPAWPRLLLQSSSSFGPCTRKGMHEEVRQDRKGAASQSRGQRRLFRARRTRARVLTFVS